MESLTETRELLMKKYLMQKMGDLVMAVLTWIDYWFTGSVSAMTPEETLNDPFKHYNLLRDNGRFLRSHRNRGWMALGYDEVQLVLRDNRLGADLRKNAFLSKMIRMAADGRTVSFLDNPTMLNLDPPDHSRLRKLANHGFVHKSILSLEPRIVELVDQLLDDIDIAGDQFDIVEVLAKPLPVIVIAELLGLPKEDVPRFQELSHRFVGLTAIGNNELMNVGARAASELHDYFADVIASKRQTPGDDLISNLIEVEEGGDRLTNEELNSTCIVLLIAGHETTTHLIGNGMHLLLENPDELRKLRDDPSLIPNAIEEMLRMEPPVQYTARTANEDLELAGRKIRKNQLVMAVIASANRDPARFDEPEIFNVSRQDLGHMAFGYGIHLCLGMTLARLESKVAFERLLSRFGRLDLAEQKIEFTPVPLNRGRQKLLINVG